MWALYGTFWGMRREGEWIHVTIVMFLCVLAANCDFQCGKESFEVREDRQMIELCVRFVPFLEVKIGRIKSETNSVINKIKINCFIYK